MSSWKYYLEAISDRLAPNYDLSANETVAGQMVDLVARFKMRSEKYFLLKKITLYAYENHETVLIQVRERITPYLARQYCGFLQQAVLELVNPDDEHMYSLVTGVLVARRGIASEARSIIERFSYSRNFKFLLQGWCEVRLLAVDLAANEVYSNKAGRAVCEAYRVPEKKGGKETVSKPQMVSQNRP